MRTILVVLTALACACSIPPAEANEPAAPHATLALADAVARGAVSIEVRGRGVDAVTLVVRAHANVEVVVPAGTYFRATAQVQDMVVTKRAAARVDRGTSVQLVVATACASFRRSVPRAEHTFTLAAAEPRLHALVTCLEEHDVADGHRQALVWEVTDGVKREEMAQRRDLLQPYLVDTCMKKLRRSHRRCTKLVDRAYELALEHWLAPRRDDARACMPSA